MERIKKIRELIEKDRVDEVTKEDIEFLEDRSINSKDKESRKLLHLYYDKTTTIEKKIKSKRTLFHKLGEMYYEGNKVEQYTKKAIEYLNKSLAKKDSYSAYLLGTIFYEGQGIEPNYELAYNCFIQGIKLGNRDIFVYIDYLLENFDSEIYANDLIKISKFAVENGMIDEELSIAYIYDKCKQNYKSAYKYYLLVEEHKDLISKDVYESAMFQLGLLYLYGTYVEQDIDKARKYFALANDTQMLNQIAYSLGETDCLDYKQVIESEKELFDENEDEYFKTIVTKINQNVEVIPIKSINELTTERLKSIDKKSLIFLDNQSIGSNISTSLYTYDQMLEIILECRKILEDIDLEQNEEDIFMQIYIKISERIKNAVDYYGNERNMILPYFNLYSLVEGEAVCSGFSIVLKTLLEMVGIECNLIDSTKHQFNQVKINNKWYYCDLCWDRTLGCLDYCLKKESLFCRKKSHKPYASSVVHESNESYLGIRELYKRNLIKLYGNDYLKHDTLKILGFVKIKEN